MLTDKAIYSHPQQDVLRTSPGTPSSLPSPQTLRTVPPPSTTLWLPPEEQRGRYHTLEQLQLSNFKKQTPWSLVYCTTTCVMGQYAPPPPPPKKRRFTLYSPTYSQATLHCTDAAKLDISDGALQIRPNRLNHLPEIVLDRLLNHIDQIPSFTVGLGSSV